MFFSVPSFLLLCTIFSPVQGDERLRVPRSFSDFVKDEATAGQRRLRSSKEYLYVWTSSGTDKADYVAVVNFKKGSKRYGKILKKAKMTDSASRSSGGNEAHHSLIVKTADGKDVLVTGGLLSFLKGKDDVFVWDLSQPKRPTLMASYNSPGGCTDEFNRYKEGVLVSQMCSDTAESPGKIAYLNLVTGNISDWSQSDDFVDFNPHGFDINEENGFLIVSDYILPSSLVEGPPLFRKTVRRLDLNRSSKELDKIYEVNSETASGFMDFRFIPGTTQGYVCGTTNNIMYYNDWSTDDTPTPVLDLAKAINNGEYVLSAGIVHFLKSRDVLLMSFGLRYLAAFDIREPENPKIFFKYDFCNTLVTGCNKRWDCSAGSPGTHYIYLTPDEDRVVVLHYFLKFGILQMPSANAVSVFNIISPMEENGLPSFEYDKSFKLDFGPDMPHSAQMLQT